MGQKYLSDKDAYHMKICDLTFLYFPRGGGIKTYIDTKRKRLQTIGIQHCIIAPNTQETTRIRKEEKGLLRIYYLPSRRLLVNGVVYYLFTNFSDIEKVLTYERPQILEIGDKFTPLIFYKKLKKLTSRLGIKVFVFSHERADNFITTSLRLLRKHSVWNTIRFRFFLSLEKMLIKKFVGVADHIICNSGFTAEEIIPYTKKEKVHILSLGIDEESFDSKFSYDENLRKKLSENEKKKVLIHVGRLDREKRIELLRELAVKLDPKHYTFVVVGSGADENLLKKIPSVFVTGYRNQEEVKKYLFASDIGVLVNDKEPFGLVALEMMAASLPILGPCSGGLSEILKRTFAWKLPYDADAYLGALKEWEEFSHKEILKNNAHKEFMTFYTSKIMVENLLKIYSQ